jgi:hypothetical protein
MGEGGKLAGLRALKRRKNQRLRFGDLRCDKRAEGNRTDNLSSASRGRHRKWLTFGTPGNGILRPETLGYSWPQRPTKTANDRRRPSGATLTYRNVEVTELAASQAHRGEDTGSLAAINMTLPALPVMVSFRFALGVKRRRYAVKRTRSTRRNDPSDNQNSKKGLNLTESHSQATDFAYPESLLC